MAEEFEDPIEAIKRRNEERARRLKERIASGEFDKFETPLEAVEESLPSGLEAIEAPESDFDLSSFPAPPEPSAIPLDEEKVLPVAEHAPQEPPAAPPEVPPAFAPPPEAAFAAEAPEIPPPLEDTFASLELTELDLEGVSEVMAPQPWDTAEAPPVEAAVPTEAPPPPEEVVPPAFELPPELEIEVEPAVAAAGEFEAPPAEEEVPVGPEPAAVGEPALREEEAEAIKATIEEELREVAPPAPPVPPPREEVLAGVAAEAAPEPAPPPAAEPAYREEAEIFIGIEVLGNKVRIERRNITLAAAIDLFRALVDRYQNR
ncbi:MAG: hypothetical protein GTN49_12660 [candidate division Zixibacteria bacterium]|nr:hypothetical protein [candidate division Zixibacteria bacterium]